MIISFKHKGLQLFYETGNTRGIQAKHAVRLRLILDVLEATPLNPEKFSCGASLHLLEPKNANIYAVKVSGNWRVTFRLTAEGVDIIDYVDYH